MAAFSKRGGLLVVFFLCMCVYAQWSVAEAHSKGHLHRHSRNGKHKPGKRFRGARVKRPEYYGSGCPPLSLSLVNSSDETSFAMTIMLADFQAATLDTKLRDQKKCFINVELTVEPVRWALCSSSSTTLILLLRLLFLGDRACQLASRTSTFVATRTCQRLPTQMRS
jgi:hypothetical protein